ncbi:phosphotransferase [Streptomyces sp. NPDC058953]|uniref:phosphotransferase n=1 Tax=unclassified Streptomyces TaxID=2593676 RepID=UPI0036896B7D
MTAEPVSRVRERASRLSAAEALIEGPLQGYHHETYVFPLPDAADGDGDGGGRSGTVRWKCREPRQGILRFDLRSFVREGALVRALAGRVSSVPETIEVDEVGLQRFIEGATLGTYRGPGTTVAEPHLDQICRLFRELAAITPRSLAVERLGGADEWVADGDCAGFAVSLIRFTEERVYRAHLPLYGELFAALGVTVHGLRRLASRMPALTARPFCLLHGDLHRENLVVDGDGRLWTIDWELAMFGDPLYDLATHLHLMRYPARQEAAVVGRWAAAVESVRPGAARGLRADLPLLLEYKRMQSVYTDVIRAARAVAGGSGAPWDVARRVRTVLARAGEPLGLAEVPTVGWIADALTACRASEARRGFEDTA